MPIRFETRLDNEKTQIKSKKMLANRKTKEKELFKDICGYNDNLENELLWLLPGEVLVGEVAVLRSLVVDGLRQIQLLYDNTRPHIEVLLDDSDKVDVLLGGTIILNED